METHANHIHKAPGKGWKHYFFEFLMLFLAVFCGFLAENLREHGVERKKEKQYMKSLWLDLQADTASLRSISSGFNESNRRINRLIRLLKDSHRNDFTCEIYCLALKIPLADKLPQPDSKTFEQLKSSGNLRLIRNRELLDKIGAYYKRYDQMMAAGPGQMLFQNRHDVYLFTYELFDVAVFQKLLKVNCDSCKEKTVLLSNDPMVINKICARYFYIQMTRSIIVSDWVGSTADPPPPEKTFLRQADLLLKSLEKEYHFEN
jgi:hypothetical protein